MQFSQRYVQQCCSIVLYMGCDVAQCKAGHSWHRDGTYLRTNRIQRDESRERRRERQCRQQRRELSVSDLVYSEITHYAPSFFIFYSFNQILFFNLTLAKFKMLCYYIGIVKKLHSVYTISAISCGDCI